MSGAGPRYGQQVRFCRAPDGVRIAYAVHGSGPPLLISTCWLSHLQFDWESPVWRHFLVDLGRFATIIRFDERGHGLFDWDVTDHSLEARIGIRRAVPRLLRELLTARRSLRIATSLTTRRELQSSMRPSSDWPTSTGQAPASWSGSTSSSRQSAASGPSRRRMAPCMIET